MHLRSCHFEGHSIQIIAVTSPCTNCYFNTHYIQLFILQVLHRRIDGAIDFKRAWTEYTSGFGFLGSEFWLGLDKLSFLTNQNVYEIRIDMENAV